MFTFESPSVHIQSMLLGLRYQNDTYCMNLILQNLFYLELTSQIWWMDRTDEKKRNQALRWINHRHVGNKATSITLPMKQFNFIRWKWGLNDVYYLLVFKNCNTSPMWLPFRQDLVAMAVHERQHAGEAIIMLLGNYENFANVVAENIIKTRCIRIKWSMCIIYNQFWIHR